MIADHCFDVPYPRLSACFCSLVLTCCQSAGSQKSTVKAARRLHPQRRSRSSASTGAATPLSDLRSPTALVKVGPDMETFDGRRSGFGYSSSGVILGFSHLHLSGAQGKYGNILVAPVTGPLDLERHQDSAHR